MARKLGPERGADCKGSVVEEAAGQPTHGLPQRPQCRAPCPDASERKRPHGRPQKRLSRRLEEVVEAVGGSYCRTK